MTHFYAYIVATTILFSVGVVHAESYWKVDNTKALTSMTVVGQEGLVYLTFLINFNSKISCFPEIGLVMATDKKLGRFEKHQWEKDGMSIYIDANKPWHEKTALSKYSNGFETTIVGNNRIIEEIKRGNEAFLSPFPGFTHFVFPLGGSTKAIDNAKENCR